VTQTRTFEYAHEGVGFRGQLALPPGAGPHPGVLVMHDGQGVGDFVVQRACDLAALGYAALAADMYGEGRRYTDPAQSTPAVLALRKDGARLRSRVVAAFDAFRGLPEVDAARIGAIGYCFGGQCVLELARSGAAARGVVSFHGTLRTHAAAQPGEVKAKVLALSGALDPFAPAADVAAFQAEMGAAGVDWQLTLYGRGYHGFTDPISDQMRSRMEGVGYDPLIDRLSWAQATAFLEAVVRG
jgi:dienelactone hydrolase